MDSKSNKSEDAGDSSAEKPEKKGTVPTAPSSANTKRRIKDVTHLYEGRTFQIVGAKRP